MEEGRQDVSIHLLRREQESNAPFSYFQGGYTNDHAAFQQYTLIPADLAGKVRIWTFSSSSPNF